MIVPANWPPRRPLSTLCAAPFIHTADPPRTGAWRRHVRAGAARRLVRGSHCNQYLPQYTAVFPPIRIGKAADRMRLGLRRSRAKAGGKDARPPADLGRPAESAPAEGDHAGAAAHWFARLHATLGDLPDAQRVRACRAFRLAGEGRIAGVLARAGLEGDPNNLPLLVEKALADNAVAPSQGAAACRRILLSDVEIVVCVHNAPATVRACLDSVRAHTPTETPVTLIDDASGPETAKALADAARRSDRLGVIRNDANLGYTRSANRGLAESAAEWVLLLNSDTVVTPGWLEAMLACAESDTAIRAVGPLSNAATVQSVPRMFDANRDFLVNDLPGGATPESVAAWLRQAARPAWPRVPVLNGFCLMLHRPTVAELGLFDAETFGRGYGEETDLCLRLVAAGHRLAIADNAFVHHARAQSFSAGERAERVDRAVAALRRKWTDYSYKRMAEAIAELPELTRLRTYLQKLWTGEVAGGA